MGIITENLFDLAGVSTTKPVQFDVTAPRESGAGLGMVVPKTKTVQPVNGVITTPDLNPGPAVVWLDNHRFEIEIGAAGITQRLRDLILAGLATPPSGPSWQSIVTGMLESLNEELANTYAPLSSIAKNPDALVSGSIVRNPDGVVTSATVTWPDGSTGTYITDAIDPSGAVNGYHITYGSPVSKTFTQPTITRDSSGNATTIPAMVVS